jgi:hypothetical protein
MSKKSKVTILSAVTAGAISLAAATSEVLNSRGNSKLQQNNAITGNKRARNTAFMNKFAPINTNENGDVVLNPMFDGGSKPSTLNGKYKG